MITSSLATFTASSPESPSAMLQDLIRPATATAASQAALSPSRRVIAPLPLEPGEPDLNECSLDNLAALADVAYRAGDLSSAELLVRSLYLQYDRQPIEVSVK